MKAFLPEAPLLYLLLKSSVVSSQYDVHQTQDSNKRKISPLFLRSKKDRTLISYQEVGENSSIGKKSIELLY